MRKFFVYKGRETWASHNVSLHDPTEVIPKSCEVTPVIAVTDAVERLKVIMSHIRTPGEIDLAAMEMQDLIKELENPK